MSVLGEIIFCCCSNSEAAAATAAVVEATLKYIHRLHKEGVKRKCEHKFAFLHTPICMVCKTCVISKGSGEWLLLKIVVYFCFEHAHEINMLALSVVGFP